LPNDRIVDVMEELVRLAILKRSHITQLTDRYSERKAAGEWDDAAAAVDAALRAVKAI